MLFACLSGMHLRNSIDLSFVSLTELLIYCAATASEVMPSGQNYAYLYYDCFQNNL